MAIAKTCLRDGSYHIPSPQHTISPDEAICYKCSAQIFKQDITDANMFDPHPYMTLPLVIREWP